jgi:hypothetical protein
MSLWSPYAGFQAARSRVNHTYTQRAQNQDFATGGPWWLDKALSYVCNLEAMCLWNCLRFDFCSWWLTACSKSFKGLILILSSQFWILHLVYPWRPAFLHLCLPIANSQFLCSPIEMSLCYPSL